MLKSHNLSKLATLAFIWLFALLVLCSCTPGSSEAEDQAQELESQPTAVPTPLSQGLRYQSWLAGAHADTYALEKGPNTYCAKCHSPQNWDRAAAIGDPPGCVSCKFPNEPEPRIAVSNPLVPEEEWQSIDCQVCHRVEEGIVDPEPAWLDIPTGYYESIASTTALCEECHRDTETLRHGREVSGSAHDGFECTDCHNAHDLTASCTGGGCHIGIAIPIPAVLPEHKDQVNTEECTGCHGSVPDIHMNILEETPVFCMECHGHLMGSGERAALRLGHGSMHEKLACVTCHDGSDLQVGPVEGGSPGEQETWITFRSTQLLGRSSTEPYISHNILLNVNCQRCHFPDNPWALPEDVEELVDGD